MIEKFQLYFSEAYAAMRILANFHTPTIYRGAFIKLLYRVDRKMIEKFQLYFSEAFAAMRILADFHASTIYRDVIFKLLPNLLFNIEAYNMPLQ